jgi:hypothetical protein
MIAKPFTPEKGVESFGIMKNPPGADPRRPNKSLVPRGAGLGAFGAEPGQLIADDSSRCWNSSSSRSSSSEYPAAAVRHALTRGAKTGATSRSPGPAFRLTITRRRSCGSRSRRTKPPSSNRSRTPVIDAVVSPVARARSPALIEPVSATMFRQLRSVALTPMRSAETCPSSCMIEPTRRMASRKSPSSCCRSALSTAAASPCAPSPDIVRTPSI